MKRVRNLTAIFTRVVLLAGFTSLALAADEVNYDDPNLAFTGGFVSDASSECVRAGASPAAVDQCIRNYGAKRETPVTDEVPLETPEKDAKTRKPNADKSTKD